MMLRLIIQSSNISTITKLPSSRIISSIVRNSRANLLNNERGFSTSSNLKKNSSSSNSDRKLSLDRTPFYELHQRSSAKFVEFAGYEMPLSYSNSGGQIAEHLSVRNSCGLFDVSHMVQSKISGKLSKRFLSKLLPSSIDSLKNYSSTLSVILNDGGGIIDDCILTRWSDDEFYLVSNAGRRSRDLYWINSIIRSDYNFSNPDNLRFETLEGWGLLALQGPRSSEILQGLLKDQSYRLDRSLFFGQSVHRTLIDGAQVHISRTGYTGEDGFEISIEPGSARSVGELLISQEGVNLIGLAARDSLRLEAGMCLYGNDLDETVGVGEAGLSWVVGKERTGFIGEERTRSEKAEKIKRRRVGLMIENGPPGRAGSKILSSSSNDQPSSSSEDEEIGIITSGIPSPSLSNQNIAMGYVKTGFHRVGTDLNVLVRNKLRKAKVVKMPFVESKFHRAPKS